MASKSKSLNTHKGRKAIVKQRYKRLIPPISKSQKNHPNYTYVALDTNIILHFADIVEGKIFHNSGEYNHLLTLFQNSVYDIDGTYSKNGKLVFVVLPEVLEELKHPKHGSPRKVVADIVYNRMIVPHIHAKRQNDFKKRTSILETDYVKKGLFTRNDAITKDGKIKAQSEFFNLTLITQDGDFGVYSKRGGNAISLKEFIQKYRQGQPFTSPQNLDFLDEKSKTALTSKRPPIKNAEIRIEK